MEKDIEQAKEQYEGVIAALNTAAEAGGRKHFKRISSATGFSSKWLSLLAAGDIDDAGFKRIVRLEAWLREHGYLHNKNDNPTPDHDTAVDCGSHDSVSPVDRAFPSFCCMTGETVLPIKSDKRVAYEPVTGVTSGGVDVGG